MAEALNAKPYLDLSNRLATVHQNYRQTGQTDRTDNGQIAYGEPFYKWSPKNGSRYAIRQLSVCPVCNVGILWRNAVGWTKMKLGMQVGLGPAKLDGDPAPPSQKGQPPIFGPRLFWPNGCMD